MPLSCDRHRFSVPKATRRSSRVNASRRSLRGFPLVRAGLALERMPAHAATRRAARTREPWQRERVAASTWVGCATQGLGGIEHSSLRLSDAAPLSTRCVGVPAERLTSLNFPHTNRPIYPQVILMAKSPCGMLRESGMRVEWCGTIGVLLYWAWAMSASQSLQRLPAWVA